jgi:pyrimidine operon attenuation protein/uracil phosphoribosyltransferase
MASHPSAPSGAPSDASGRRISATGSQAGSSSGEGIVSVDPASDRSSIVLDHAAIERSLTRIAHEIVERHEDLSKLYLVAIPNGGVPLGRILQRNLASISGVELPLGILDTTLYRDDLSRNGVRPQLRLTEMPSSVDDRIVLVVEDVVSTGRTIRAAMDAMIDFGRPTSVQVVALIDRGHRELPIKIDYVGKNIPTGASDKVKFRSRKLEDGSNATELEPPFEVVLMAAAETVEQQGETSGNASVGVQR